MWVFMLIGLITSLTGLMLAFDYVRRLLRVAGRRSTKRLTLLYTRIPHDPSRFVGDTCFYRKYLVQGLELVAKLEAYRTARHVVAVLLGVVLIVEVVYIDTEAEALLDGVVQRSTEDQCRGCCRRPPQSGCSAATRAARPVRISG